MNIIRRLIREEAAQDIVEYALLSAFFGIVAVVAFSNIPDTMAEAYGSWDTSVQDLWVPPEPAGS